LSAERPHQHDLHRLLQPITFYRETTNTRQLENCFPTRFFWKPRLKAVLRSCPSRRQKRHWPRSTSRHNPPGQHNNQVYLSAIVETDLGVSKRECIFSCEGGDVSLVINILLLRTPKGSRNRCRQPASIFLICTSFRDASIVEAG
jgi:hypothetical protein